MPLVAAGSLLAVSFINVLSGRRHLAGFVRTAEVCSCGCGGHDTIHGLMSVAAMIAEALVTGTAPKLRHDGEPHEFYQESAMSIRPGEDLGFRGVFVFVKGDWAEYQKSLGLGSWQKFHSPCPMCTISKDDMMSDLTGLGFAALPFEDRTKDDYERSCAQSEHRVRLATAKDLQDVASALSYFLKGKSAKGRAIMTDLPQFGLLRGDILEPSRDLINPNLLEKSAAPIDVVFWRTNLDAKGRNTDWLSHRSPIFGDRTGIYPGLHLTVDSLHCVYLGVMQKWTSAAIHRLLEANPWEQVGDFKLQMLVDELREWQRVEGIHANRRIRNITPKMIGDPDVSPHPGCLLKLKGAETRIMFAFCVNAVRKYFDQVELGLPLLRAGEALANWMVVQDSASVRLTTAEYQALVDSSVRHRAYVFASQVGPLPKHHAHQHLSSRTVLLLFATRA